MHELLFGSIYDKSILSVKKIRARLIYLTKSKKHEWVQEIKKDTRYLKVILKDENILNLFLDKNYRKELKENIEIRTTFIYELEKRL